jgi:lysozyme
MSHVDSNKAAAYIELNEGYRRHKYVDSVGVETIGIGFNIEEGFSVDESRMILRMRMRKFINELSARIPVYCTVSCVRKIVLLDMAYNLGIGRLSKFKKMIAALDSRDYELAAKEMLDSTYAKQVKGRAKRNAHMMETGEWFE